MGGAWTPAGADQAAVDLWHGFGTAGPLLLSALLAILVARALVRRRRYRIAGAFTEEDRRAVHEAIATAERRTVGEILPVIVERSDAHPAADWLAALTLVLSGSALLASWLPWHHPPLLLLSQLALGGVGFALARLLPDFKRWFVSEARASEVVAEQAFQEFYANGLHRTEAATGVLLFVSLFERRSVILADAGIDAEVDAGFWASTDDAILDGVRRGSLREGLLEGIRRAGDGLARHFPWGAGDRNEVPDRLIVRPE
jgi:putative membrane protein